MLYAGIDEAGYGPVLGPLCVGFAALEIDNWREGDAAPDLWKLLSRAVCKDPPRGGGKARVTRIAVNDSKRLKGPNSLKTRHPLAHLERGVLAFMQAIGESRAIADDRELLSALGTPLDEPGWYGGEPVALPLSTTPDHQHLAGVQLIVACEQAGVRVADVRCHAMPETVFNERLRALAPEGTGDALASKAAVSFGIVAGFLRRVWNSRACVATTAGGGAVPRVMVDRQGGRTAYSDVLDRAFPDALITILGESPTRSTYELTGLGESDGRKMRLCFQTEAETAHLPVALASMTAKLVRELAMARFNRYWCARIAELKPTAGYAQDGERWLSDVRGRIEASEMRALRRLA